MNSVEIRETYLKFFEERGHTRHPSASLVPDNDPTLLFTGAGMNQFKDMFLGRGTLPFRRATTTQKCLRLPDLDNVGRTASHHTFFEMLGNFSFGDYFKEEAIAWADELLRDRFGLSRDRLRVTVYQDDDEAFELWQRIGYPREHIFRCGEVDNFWPSEAPSKGPNGPCGPCSEIYFDFGAERGGSDHPAVNGKRFVEVWNLVFTQYERQDGGKLTPLPQRNIDTGMGFERLVRVLQGGKTNFDTDLFQPILARLQELTGRAYGESADLDRPMRRIADHVRAVTFCIADGVVPSNEKQGYVVRKILRRAVSDGLDLLGMQEPFVGRLVPAVIGVPGLARCFPEIRRLESKIVQVVSDEEQKFLETYHRGRERLAEEVRRLEAENKQELPGRVAFFLWDTAGFPLDLTRRVLAEKGFRLDEQGYDEAMEEQRRKSQAGSNISGEIFATGPLQRLKGKLPPTVFLGYEHSEAEATVRALLRGEEQIEHAEEGDEVVVLFAETPFYAESGGQVGDRGEFGSDSFRVRIRDTVKKEGFHLHRGVVISGSVAVGDSGRLRVDVDRHRGPTMRNHTATHIVHWALRRVLGEAVEQKGSLVDAERLRFDFRHKGAVSRELLDEVENLVNEQILKNLPVSKVERSFQEAVDAGAMALFGEKYGERVRVVAVEDPVPDRRSVELCGGTHVAATGDIGAFKIVTESGVAAGIRRIEAVTGQVALRYFQTLESRLREAAQLLKATPEEVGARITALQEELRRARREREQAERHQGADALEAIRAGGQMVAGVQLFSGHLPGAPVQALLGAVDQLKQEGQTQAVVLLGEDDGKIPVVVYLSPDVQKRGAHAGRWCKQLCARLGGGGGGNPGLGRGQGQQGTDASELLASLPALLESMVGSESAG